MDMTGFLVFCAIVIAYLLPALIAGERKHANATSIFVVNLFFGWTVLGWIACLAWSVSGSGKHC